MSNNTRGSGMTDLGDLARFISRNLDHSPERLLTLIREKFPEATSAEIVAAVRVLDDPDFNRGSFWQGFVRSIAAASDLVDPIGHPQRSRRSVTLL